MTEYKSEMTKRENTKKRPKTINEVTRVSKMTNGPLMICKAVQVSKRVQGGQGPRGASRGSKG